MCCRYRCPISIDVVVDGRRASPSRTWKCTPRGKRGPHVTLFFPPTARLIMSEYAHLLPGSSRPRQYHTKTKIFVLVGGFAALTALGLTLLFTGKLPGIDKPFDKGPEDPLDRAYWLLSKTKTPIIDGHIDFPVRSSFFGLFTREWLTPDVLIRSSHESSMATTSRQSRQTAHCPCMSTSLVSTRVGLEGSSGGESMFGREETASSEGRSEGRT